VLMKQHAIKWIAWM